MRAGRLDRLIDIQRKTDAPSGSGEPVESWNDIAQRKPASMKPIKGDERFGPPEMVALEQIEFRVRYSASLVGLSPLDRIIYPAMADASPPSDPETRRIHNILAVHEIGRREGFQIIAVRRPDVSP